MVTIDYLANFPESIPLLAKWFHSEWASFDNRSVSEIAEQLPNYLNTDTIPIAFVAHRETELVGTVSLDISDLPGFDHLSPWLASLYVDVKARGQGIGSSLIHYASRFAVTHGKTPLYLWTPGSTRRYERFGWAVFHHTRFNSHPITLMQFKGESQT